MNIWSLHHSAESQKEATSPFHFVYTVLNKVGSWVNIGTVTNQFSHQFQISFVYLQRVKESDTTTLITDIKVVGKYISW